MTATATAIDTLTGRDESLRWVESFVLRGRTFTLRDGMSTFGDGWASLPVWNASGRATSVKVRETDRVEVLTRK